MKPDIVFLNLSLEEFPNRLKDLPKDLVELSLKNPKVKIGWDCNIDFGEDIVIDISNSQMEVSTSFISDSIINNNELQYDVIVSLTSFPSRFRNSELIIRCLTSLVKQVT